MENLISIKNLLENEHILKGRLFTKIQFNILKKRFQKKNLNSTEKTYYYKFISPKIKAMAALFNAEKAIVQGKEFIVSKRLAKAKKILKNLEKKYRNKKIMLSGSFLFNKRYNDIDAFVFLKYKKEDYRRGKLHVNFMQESALDSMFFASVRQISVSNFNYSSKMDFSVNPNELMQSYELLINAMLNKEKNGKYLRDFILVSEYASKSVIADPKEIYNIKHKLLRKNTGILSGIFINTLALDSNKQIKKKVMVQIDAYKKMKKEYKSSKNIEIYLDTYKKVIELAP